MKILLILLGAVFTSQRTINPRILAGGESKAEFFQGTTRLLFEKINEYFSFYLGSDKEINFKKHDGKTWSQYNIDDKTLDEGTLGIFIKEIEVFRLRLKSNIKSSTSTQNNPELSTVNNEADNGGNSGLDDEDKGEDGSEGEVMRLVKRRNLSEGPELRSSTTPSTKERTLLDFNEKDLCIELSNSALKSVLTIQYGFNLTYVIRNFILRNLQAFLFKTEQVVISLNQIESDISNLFEVVFQNFGSNSPKAKVVDKVEGLQRAPNLLEVDIDKNYHQILKVFRKEENQLLLTLQKVQLEDLKGDAALARSYFETTIEELKEANRKRENGDPKEENANFETLIYVVSPNKPSLDPIELMIIKNNGKILLVAYSSFFQIEQVYSECTQRYIIKSLEKEFVKIRDNILARVLALQESKPKKYQVIQMAEEIENAFGGLFEKEEGSGAPLAFKSKAGLPNPFRISLTQLRDEIELLFTATFKSTQGDQANSGSDGAEIQTIVIRKRYPVTSLYYTKGFPESFIKELATNVLLVVPRFKESNSGSISFETSNFGYYKNVAMPFVDVTEVMQDVQRNIATFSKQEGRKKNQLLKQFFYLQNKEPVSRYTVDYAWTEIANPKQDNPWKKVTKNKNLRVLEAIIRNNRSAI